MNAAVLRRLLGLLCLGLGVYLGVAVVTAVASGGGTSGTFWGAIVLLTLLAAVLLRMGHRRLRR